MATENQRVNPITEAALRGFTKDELAKMSQVSLTNLGVLIERKLAKGPVTDDQLRGIKDLVLNHP